MLYSNITLYQEIKKLDFSEVKYFEAGEEGRARRSIRIFNNTEIERINYGLNNIDIGQTKSGSPKIVNTNTGKFVLLSSEKVYHRGGRDGQIIILNNEENVKLLANGYGAHGDAGRLGSWQVHLYEIINNENPIIFKIEYENTQYNEYVIVNDNILKLSFEELKMAYDVEVISEEVFEIINSEENKIKEENKNV